MPSSSQAPVACSSFAVGQAEEQQAADAEGGGLFGFLTASSTERLKTPGMELTSLRTPSPGQMKSG